MPALMKLFPTSAPNLIPLGTHQMLVSLLKVFREAAEEKVNSILKLSLKPVSDLRVSSFLGKKFGLENFKTDKCDLIA